GCETGGAGDKGAAGGHRDVSWEGSTRKVGRWRFPCEPLAWAADSGLGCTHSMAREEVLDPGAHLAPATDHAIGRRQALQQRHAVAAIDHPGIEQHHHADIGGTANQSTEPLLELERRMWQQVAEEAILTLLRQAFKPGRSYGLARNLERQLGQHQSAQRAARHVDTLPERIGSEQDRVAGLAKPPQQLVTAAVPLNQDREA